MATIFGPNKISVHGSFGEFTIGDSSSSTIRAKYILTKIKPGNDGTPECELASQMLPWREIFNVEELNFDELLQRDLDDSRVAHDLIPYLLGESGNRAKFFPPILAVIVPRKSAGSGIEGFYPPRNAQEEWIEEYGDLFDVEQMKWDGEPTPLAQLSYNRQRSAFVIVDGQHRAMAVLALHRQLNENWGDNPFVSYYNHISVTSEQVKNIELPTCIIYFPDLHEDNSDLQEEGINLNSVCREIFLVVNRSAKTVSKSRELLLDDTDIAAHLMRRTLSKLKKQDKRSAESARIYTISYEDSDAEDGEKEVISGQLKYSSAIALHKIHKAIFFGQDDVFKIDGYYDILDRRRRLNHNRPPEILLGTDVEHLNPLECNSGKSHPSDEVAKVVEKLGDLADIVLVSLFNQLRPFEVHNSELQSLKMRLSDVQARTQIEQKKAYTLIFEGGGIRNVFESHFERLKREEREYDGQTVPGDLQSQIEFCESVERVLDNHERDFQRRRACKFFNINQDLFDIDNNRDDQRVLNQKAYQLFQTLATQAFQLGYAMAIFTVVEELKRARSTTSTFPYQDRLKLVEFVTRAYLAALNTYFTPTGNTIHRTLKGYIAETRASVFDPNNQGLRGLLAMSVNELNERRWRFFRYAILEIVHSPFCWSSVQEKMIQMDSKWPLEWYKEAIPRLVEGIISEREKYVKDAINAALRDNDFQSYVMQTTIQAETKGRSKQEVQKIIEELETARKVDADKRARAHLKASLEIVEEKEDMIERLSNGL